MPGSERGILGIKKDPKNQLLFTYTGGEDWPSSDSNDSDYEPDDCQIIEDVKPVERKPKQVKKRAKKKSERDKDASEVDEGFGSEGSQDNADDLWGQRIPPEILLRIFHCCVTQHKSLPFLCRASQVCRLWHETTKHAALWESLDLSYGWIKSMDNTLIWLCENRGSRIKELNLQTWKHLTPCALQVVGEHCPLLEYINMSYCSKITSQGLRMLIDNCPNLCSLEMAFMGMDVVSAQSMKYLLETLGGRLKLLNLSGNMLVGFNTIVNNCIATMCPNLELLDLSNCVYSTDFLSLNIEKLQHGCPKLKILRVTNSKFRAAQASGKARVESLGFPQLEELSVAISPEGINHGIGMNNEVLHRLLKSSSKLRLLDIRGSTHLSAQGLQILPVSDLTHLYLSQSSIAKYDGIEVIMQKWQHSLEELDLSWNIYPGMSLDLAMRKLSDDPSKSRLQTLNLSGTCISCSRLKSLLEGCPNLTSVNLGSCRGLQRGMKREYNGTSLQKLREEIDSLIEQEAEEFGKNGPTLTQMEFKK